jgi:t-SNARE complex subunit (syntaxin)
MSFNDLERGATSSPPPIRSGGNNNNNATNNASTGGLNGQQYNRGSSRSNRNNNARGPLPLYHAPRSSSDSGNNDTTPAPVQSDPEFKRLAERIGIQVFKLNSNVQGIDKLVELQLRKMRNTGNQTAATKSSDKDWTAQIHDLTESTRALVKDLSGSIKDLAGFQPSSLSQTDRLTATKLQRDFESAINAFAKAQRESAKLSRSMLDGAKEERERTLRAASSSGQDANKVAVNETLVQIDDSQPTEGGQQQQIQQQEQRQSNEPSQAEIEFQETLIAERESEIREIENGIQELNEIFRDLGHIVQEQGGMIDNIEYNVQTIATNTGAADRELVSASDYQRRAGRRAACLMLIVGFVVAIVLLAVS